jgi:hypothetical protein
MTLAHRVARLAASRWFRFLALAGLASLAVVSLYPGDGTLPRTRLPGALEHFLAYAAVATVAAFAFQGRVRVWLLAALMIAYAARAYAALRVMGYS